MATKMCRRCREDRPVGEFSRSAANKDGLGSYCRRCQAERQREARRGDSPYAQRQRASARQWKAQNRERALALGRTPEKVAYNAEWQRRNVARRVASNRRFRQTHPEFNKERCAVRYARQRGATVNDLTESQWQAILAAHGDRCAYCGRGGRLQRDHVIPLSRGGDHTRANVVPACASCNPSKGDRTPTEWQEAFNAKHI